MQFCTLALGTVLTVATLVGTPSFARAEALVKTVAQPSELQTFQYPAANLETNAVTIDRVEVASNSAGNRTLLLKAFTLSAHKDAAQHSQSVSVHANLYGLGSSPSFEGEGTLGQSLGYRHLDFSSQSN
jgi:hypothetical protein